MPDEQDDLETADETEDVLSEEDFLPPGVESRPEEPQVWKDVPHGSLRFKAPAGWEDRSLLTLIEPEGGGFRHSIVVGLEPTSMDLDRYAEVQVALLRKSLPRADVGDPAPRATERGLAYVEVRTKIPRGDDLPVRQVIAMFVHGGQAYTVTGSACEEGFEAWRAKVFEPVLRDVEIGDGRPGA